MKVISRKAEDSDMDLKVEGQPDEHTMVGQYLQLLMQYERLLLKWDQTMTTLAPPPPPPSPPPPSLVAPPGPPSPTPMDVETEPPQPKDDPMMGVGPEPVALQRPTDEKHPRDLVMCLGVSCQFVIVTCHCDCQS